MDGLTPSAASIDDIGGLFPVSRHHLDFDEISTEIISCESAASRCENCGGYHSLALDCGRPVHVRRNGMVLPGTRSLKEIRQTAARVPDANHVSVGSDRVLLSVLPSPN